MNIVSILGVFDRAKNFLPVIALKSSVSFQRRPTANSMKCYKPFYMSVNIFMVTGSLKYCQIDYACARQFKNFISKSENKHKNIEFDNTCGCKCV